MVTFKTIFPEQTERLWPVLKGAFAEIQARQPETLDWKPADVMLQLVQGCSRLAIIYQEEKGIGYFIFRIVGHELTGKRTLQIWLGGLFPECRKGLVELKVIMAAIRAWCQTEYPMPIELISRRKGWERVLKDIFNFYYSVYRAEAPV